MWFKLTEKQRLNDGSTAVCAIVRANTLFTANVGDSRAILLRERKAIQLTDDHKPMKYAGFACVFLLLQYRTALTVRAWCWFNRLEAQRRIASFGGSVDRKSTRMNSSHSCAN